ncbi:MAG: hypothetical protein ABIC57_01215, partial [bacterium]
MNEIKLWCGEGYKDVIDIIPKVKELFSMPLPTYSKLEIKCEQCGLITSQGKISTPLFSIFTNTGRMSTNFNTYLKYGQLKKCPTCKTLVPHSYNRNVQLPESFMILNELEIIPDDIKHMDRNYSCYCIIEFVNSNHYVSHIYAENSWVKISDGRTYISHLKDRTKGRVFLYKINNDLSTFSEAENVIVTQEGDNTPPLKPIYSKLYNEPHDYSHKNIPKDRYEIVLNTALRNTSKNPKSIQRRKDSSRNRMDFNRENVNRKLKALNSVKKTKFNYKNKESTKQFKIASCNANGINDILKFEYIFQKFFIEEQCDIVCIQETHISREASKWLTLPHKGCKIFADGRNIDIKRTGDGDAGVAILTSNKTNVLSCFKHEFAMGHLLDIDVSVGYRTIRIINLYGPTGNSEKLAKKKVITITRERINDALKKGYEIILAGDGNECWNGVLAGHNLSATINKGIDRIYVSQGLSQKNFISKTLNGSIGGIFRFENRHLPITSTIHGIWTDNRKRKLYKPSPITPEFNEKEKILKFTEAVEGTPLENDPELLEKQITGIACVTFGEKRSLNNNGFYIPNKIIDSLKKLDTSTEGIKKKRKILNEFMKNKRKQVWLNNRKAGFQNRKFINRVTLKGNSRKPIKGLLDNENNIINNPKEVLTRTKLFWEKIARKTSGNNNLLEFTPESNSGFDKLVMRDITMKEFKREIMNSSNKKAEPNNFYPEFIKYA